jgi:lipopolysaccharide/colanic/teichoic acid biosynthesis glycosyltransferase
MDRDGWTDLGQVTEQGEGLRGTMPMVEDMQAERSGTSGVEALKMSSIATQMAEPSTAVRVDGSAALQVRFHAPSQVEPAEAAEILAHRHLLGLQAVCKRAIDILFSGAVLLMAAPLIALVAVLVKLDSPGPVFYRAERVGQGGRRLRMLKFRKMHHDAAGAPLTMSADNRFTRVGAMLAKTKIDEIPQLWHVLRGEMSLIGPRPEDPSFVAERFEDYAAILAVRPGVTGLSQIAFAEESEILDKADPMAHYRARIFPQKIRLDQLYALRWGVRMDTSILFWTCAAVLLRRQVAVHRGTGRMNLRRR